MRSACEAPASHAQRAIWTLQRIEPSLDVFSGGYAATADQPLDRAVLSEAVRGLVHRHETMRTTFHASGERLVQRIHAHMDIPVAWHDANEDTDSELVDRMLADLRQPYDLERGPLLRVGVYVRATGEQVVLVGSHHITCDLLSARLLMEELEERYDALAAGAPVPIEPLPVQFRELVEWQQAMLEGDEGRRHGAYWRERLAGEVPDLDLPIDHGRPRVEVHRGRSCLFTVPTDLMTRLGAVAAAADATLYSALLAGYAVLLHRFSGAAVVTVGSYTSGRVRRALDPMVGLVSHAIPLRLTLDHDEPFVNLVRETGRVVRGAFRHQAFPLALMAEQLGRPRDPSRSPLFSAVFNLVRDEPLRKRAPAWRHDPWIPLQLRNQEGQIELKLMTSLGRDGSLMAALQYQTALYEDSTAERLARAWVALLEDVAGNPTRTVAAIDLLGADEEQRVVRTWNQTDRDYPRETGAHELVRARCRATPDAPAISHGDRTITYGQLARRVAGQAARLREAGAGAGSVIGLCLPPSIEQVVTLLAVLQTGAAYLPLDPAHPSARRRAMLDDAGATLLVGDHRSIEDMAVPHPRSIDVASSIDCDPPEPSTQGEGGERLAYVLFTSGSTGRPKGVEVTHRSLVNLLTAMQDLLAVTPADTWLSVTTLSFDIAALEIFLPLVCGAQLVMADRDVAGNGARLAEAIDRHRATIVQATPTSWRLLQAQPRRPSHPITRLCGGEALTRALADQLLRDPGPLWNVYGPTETTIWSTASRVTAGDRAPTIGRPLANTQTYVLDARLRPVPVGVVGDLWIGGAGVARGYVGRPELTAERFVPDPFSRHTDARIYRTGDLARWLASGEIEFVGREDQQVKIRGIRIELGEIEAALLDRPEVADAVVVARQDGPGEPRLVGYVVPARGCGVEPMALRRSLRDRLPDYMVPAAFVELEALPLTPNRKVDRRALPAPDGQAPSRAYVAPRTAVEQALARFFAEVLAVPRVGLDDDFFDLGGASIASLELASLARQGGLDLQPEAIFEHRSVRSLAAALAGAPVPGDDCLRGVS